MFNGMMVSQKYCAIPKSVNEMIIEIPNIKGVDNRLNMVPCMNEGCIFLSTIRCPFNVQPYY
jgi:hypothetical protein